MNNKNKALFDLAREAINDLFNDRSVSKEKAKENLEGLIEEMQVMIESLDID